MGGPRGHDAGKKTKGRERHILVDALGLALVILVLTQTFKFEMADG